MSDSWDILTGDAARDRRNVSILMESVAELYGTGDLDETTRRAVDRAIQVTGAERGILLIEQGGRLLPTVARARGGRDLPLDLKFSRSVVDKVRTSGNPYLTMDAEDDQAVSLGRSVLELRLLSIMATPLTTKGQRLGYLYVDSTVQAKEFTQADFRVFKSLGGLIALAVESERLQVARLEKERMEQALAFAHEVQQRLQPRDIARVEGYDLAGVGRTCEETSGDYYDVIPLEDGRIALAVGDVSGHGPGPALFMASARALLHALLGREESAVELMGDLNRFLARDMPSNAFMTFCLAVLEPAARRLTYVNAGHNPPLLVRAHGELETLPGTGPVLGVLEDAPYGLGREIHLEAGDSLLLYSDGIFEARGPDGEIWGEDRFVASCRTHAARASSAAEVVSGVLADLDRYRAGVALGDDLTCLVLKVR